MWHEPQPGPRQAPAAESQNWVLGTRLLRGYHDAEPTDWSVGRGSDQAVTKPDPAEQSRSRRERILDAAFSAFATRGYRDTAVDDIAGAAETSKGGIYFHFPNKESIFRELMQTTADKLVGKVEKAVAAETEPVARAEVALHTVLTTFAGHRTTARLLFLDTVGAGRVFQVETNALHERFARLIQGYLDEAVASGAIPPTDTRITSIAWFGALNEVVARWLQAAQPARLEDAYPALRATLLRSAGVPEERIGPVAPPEPGWDFPETPR
jgi:AcrR family transcriptional regulator